MKNRKISTKDITEIGAMIAIIEVCKVALSFAPNIELTTFWIIMFSLFFGKKIYAVIPAFILIEGSFYGFGLWWLMYLYTWPLLVLLTKLFKKQESIVFWSVFSSLFGLSFGFWCSFPYFFMGLFSGGLRSGIIGQFTWWVAGIPWDVVHGIGNFILMFILYKPISKIIKAVV